MKKKIATALLSLVAMTAMVGCATTNPSDENTNTSQTETVKEAHSVTVTSGEGVYTASNVSKAKEGEKVTVTVVTTDATFKVDSVKLGEKTLNAEVDKTNKAVATYTFLMPDAAANVTVTTSKIVAPKKDHTITLTENANVEVLGLGKEANKGETVNFKVRLVPGFDLDKIEVKAGEEVVEVKGDSVTGYNFVMPDKDVTVTITSLGNYYNLAEDKTENEFHYYSYSSQDAITEYRYGDNLKVPADEENFFRAGEKVKLVINRRSDFEATDFYLNGVKLVADEVSEEDKATADITYSFVMPQGDSMIKATMDFRSKGITVNAPEVDTFIYTLGEDGTTKVPATTVSTEAPVYIDAKVKDGVEGRLGNIDYTATLWADSTSFKTKKKTVAKEMFEEANGYGFSQVDKDTIAFKLPYEAFYSDIVVNIEVDKPIYKAFEGVYKGFEWDGHKFNSSSKDVTITGYGDIDSTVSSLQGYVKEKVDDKTIVATQNLMSWNTKDRYLNFDNDALWFSFSAKSSESYESYYTDVYLLAKVTADEKITGLGYVGEGFDVCELVTGEAGSYVTKVAYLVNYSEKTIVSNVTLNFTSGTHVNDEGAAFTVSKDGTVLKTVEPAPAA